MKIAHSASTNHSLFQVASAKLRKTLFEWLATSFPLKCLQSLLFVLFLCCHWAKRTQLATPEQRTQRHIIMPLSWQSKMTMMLWSNNHILNQKCNFVVVLWFLFVVCHKWPSQALHAPFIFAMCTFCNPSWSCSNNHSLPMWNRTVIDKDGGNLFLVVTNRHHSRHILQLIPNNYGDDWQWWQKSSHYAGKTMLCCCALLMDNHQNTITMIQKHSSFAVEYIG